MSSRGSNRNQGASTLPRHFFTEIFLKKNTDYGSVHQKNTQLGCTKTSLTNSVKAGAGAAKRGNSKHGSRAALNPHAWSPRGTKTLLSGRLFLLIRFVLSPGRNPEPFDFLPSSQLCHFGWPFPNLGCFPLGAAGPLRCAYQEPSPELSLS